MIALSMVLSSHTMSLGGVFMMLGCFVMCVFWHVDILNWNRYFDSLIPEQVMNHSTYRPLMRHRSSQSPFTGHEKDRMSLAGIFPSGWRPSGWRRCSGHMTKYGHKQ